MSSYPSVTHAERLDPIVREELELLCAQIEGILRSAGVQSDGTLKQATVNGPVVATSIEGASLKIGGPIRYTGVLTPPTLVANVNDYFPEGLAGAYLIRVSAAGPLIITGLGYGGANRQTAGDRKLLVNVGAAAITLVHESGGSSGWNHFHLPNDADWVLGPGEGLELQRDDVDDRWRAVSGQVAGTDVVGDTGTFGELLATENIAASGSITPAAIGSNQNDYFPAGIGSCYAIRLEASGAPRAIGGLEGAAAPGIFLLLINVGPTFAIALTHEEGGSTAANRFAFPDEEDWTLEPYQAIELWYDANSSRWRPTSGQIVPPPPTIPAGITDTITLQAPGGGASTWDLEFTDGWLTNRTFNP